MTIWGRVAMAAVCLLTVMPANAVAAPSKAIVREYKQVFRTYPFSDPDPIATPGRLYPYYRFDGYTDQAVNKEWTVVELENDWIKVIVLPEIGGKIWTAIEKSTNRAFIYNNHVVKFRDVAMRGAWTSGGIEPNFGILGHTPNVATPVDYVTRTNPDGSASIVIGALDLLTRTAWRVDITLPPDKAYFTTRVFWSNTTGIEQPYYTWMNAGLKAAGNLELVYPGTAYLGHEGEFAPWPINPANGKNISFYEQNNFGGYKSYHVFGRRTDFFGAYWHDDNFGMARYSRRDDIVGKKAWIWGLSRQGMIWEPLLTDSDGQYVEVQSGRLFNQSVERSTYSPFKHRGFAPYSSDTWTEYWFPIKATGGFMKANDVGALNVLNGAGKLTLKFSPLQTIDDTLEVLDGDRVIFTTRLKLLPMQTWSTTIDATVPADKIHVRIGGSRFDYQAGDGDVLSRPIETPKDFDWQSVFGLDTQGKELIRQREYERAETALIACLKKNPNYLPALVDLAVVRYRAMDYRGAWTYARKALSIDTYDPAANYYYGLAAYRLGKLADAMDGFELAAQSPDFRVAARTELARIYLARGDFAHALEYAARSLESDPNNIEAYQLQAVAERGLGHSQAAIAALNHIAALDPLSHFAHFERHLHSGDEASRQAFVKGIRNEMPQETFLELAIWYYSLGRLEESQRVLALAPVTPETRYWLAFLQAKQNDSAFQQTLSQADAASPRLIFPFRIETADVLRWAITQTSSWRPKYYLSLVLLSHDEVAPARELLETCGQAPDFAPFYVVRASVLEAASRDRVLSDLQHAAELDPHEWRFGKLLVERAIEDKDYTKALEIATRYYSAQPSNDRLGLLSAKALLLNSQPAEASALLDRLNVLPREGSKDERALYREAHLLLAISEARSGRFEAAHRQVATAREWPEHLGAGKPYPEEVDERLEDWLDAQYLARLGRITESHAVLDRAIAWQGVGGIGQLVAAIALEETGRAGEAQRTLAAWASQQIDPRVADWGRKVVSGGHPLWPEGAQTSEEHRVLLASLEFSVPASRR